MATDPPFPDPAPRIPTDPRRHRLAEIVGAVRRRFPAAMAPAAGALPVRPTGVMRLDGLLPGGGLPLGRVSLLCGAPSTGRTGLALAALASTRDTPAAWVDGPSAFHPPSAALAGVDLGRLLLVQPPAGDLVEGLHAATLLLRTGALSLLVLDATASVRTHLPEDALARFGRAVGAGCACLVLAGARPPPGLLRVAALGIRLERRTPLWAGANAPAPRALGGLTVTATLVRSRLGGEGRQAEMTLMRGPASRDMP